MALCSVDDVRVHVNPDQITDADITNIIAVVTTNILTRAGSTDQTNAYLIQAAIHAAAAITLKRARAIGELSSNDTPEFKITFTGIIEEIKRHEEDRDEFLRLYQISNPSYTFASYADNIGITSHTHSHCGGHHGFR